MSFPDRNTVALEERARTAKDDEEETIEESKTVRTLGKLSGVNASGETEKIICSQDMAFVKSSTRRTRIFIKREQLRQQGLRR
jgi:hypothetical protein